MSCCGIAKFSKFFYLAIDAATNDSVVTLKLKSSISIMRSKTANSSFMLFTSSSIDTIIIPYYKEKSSSYFTQKLYS